jgi:hypothetical protein
MTARRFILCLLGVVLLLILTLLPFTIHAQLAAPDTFELESVRCWRHMLEADDVLMVARYNVYYGNVSQQPYQDITETVYFEYETAGSSYVGNETAAPWFNLGYRKGIVAFYWGANETGTPPWGDLGTVHMTGTDLFGGSPPSDSLALTSGDWVSATQPSSIREDLRQWLLNALIFLELDWNTYYSDIGMTDRQVELVMTAQGNYNVASPSGEAYMRESIEDIETICPLLFMFQLYAPTIEDREHTLSQQTTIESQHEGDVVGNTTARIGNLLGGIDRIWASTLVILIAGLVIVYICQSRWQKMNCGLLTSYTLILLATPEGLFQMGLMGLFAFMAILQITYTLFWRRSAG